MSLNALYKTGIIRKNFMLGVKGIVPEYDLLGGLPRPATAPAMPKAGLSVWLRTAESGVFVVGFAKSFRRLRCFG